MQKLIFFEWLETSTVLRLLDPPHVEFCINIAIRIAPILHRILWKAVSAIQSIVRRHQCMWMCDVSLTSMQHQRWTALPNPHTRRIELTDVNCKHLAQTVVGYYRNGPRWFITLFLMLKNLVLRGWIYDCTWFLRYFLCHFWASMMNVQGNKENGLFGLLRATDSLIADAKG